MAHSKHRNPVGSLPIDLETCAILRDKRGTMICESYVYRVGFFRFNWHPSLEILFVLDGKLRVFTERGVFPLAENDFIVIQPNEGHASMLEAPGTIAAVLHISQKYLESVCHSIPKFGCVYNGTKERDAAYYRIREAFASFYRLASSCRDAGRLIYAESELLAVIGTLIMNFSLENKGKNANVQSGQQSKKLDEVLRQIDKSYLHELTLEALAECVGMNPSYLSSFFKKHMQIGFHEYLTRKRLAQAVWELNNSGSTVLEIAINSGFPDAKAFYAAFRRYFGMTPNQYRNELSSKVDANVQNFIPTRLHFHDPFVQKKLHEFGR